MEQIEHLVSKVVDDKAASAEKLAAFGQIVCRFQDMAYGCAYAILGDFHLAQDAAQEAFLVAYRQLPNLRNPKAFPGWFRQIVLSQCHHLTRRRHAGMTSLDAAITAVSTEPKPPEIMEKREMKDTVLAAIQALPEHQRMATTLFYINGYSQNDIAEFLEVPVTTVKKRLADSRSRLKKRMIAMVEKTLHDNAPDERFSEKVIEELLGRPRLLEIEGHPIRKVLDTIRAAFPEYEFIEGEEIIQESTLLPGAPDPDIDEAVIYHVDEQRVLRTSTTVATITAMTGRTPPVRLLTAGRAFRAGKEREDANHSRVFHMLGLLCVESGLDVESMKNQLQRSIEAVLGSLEARWDKANFKYFERCLEITVNYRDKWTELGGCGMIPPHRLKEAGYDPEVVSGFAFGIGLERLAMLKYDIDDIRKLWQPPYVP